MISFKKKKNVFRDLVTLVNFFQIFKINIKGFVLTNVKYSLLNGNRWT